VLSKGHAAPILYAAWAEAGAFPRERLLTLRRIDSDLQGHPTPETPFVDVATGSLGQGLAAGLGIALMGHHFERSDQRVYVLMGDGESAEGSVWEAAQWAGQRRIANLCATIDVNRLGQSEPTMLEHHMEQYRTRWEAFGWQALVVDGHDIDGLLAAYRRAAETTDRPTVVLARTVKGKGLSGVEGEDNWHGKPLDKETAARVVRQLEGTLTGADGGWKPHLPPARRRPAPEVRLAQAGKPPYQPGGKHVATRKGFGDGLAALSQADPRIVCLDGDVKNSTHTDEFQKAAPDRFFQCYIAEQTMVAMAMGLAARGKVPFAATFACFFTRACDFIRMAAISRLPIKLAGTHAGVSIGEDGPSQMGLEDLAMVCAQPGFMVLYPADATAAWHSVRLAAEHPGPAYLRLGRPNTPILYGPGESFEAGKCKVLRQSPGDRALVIAAGVTVFEALAAHERLLKEGIPIRVIDLFSVEPIDADELSRSARAAGGLVFTVEDHYAHGGIGDAVLRALAREPAKVIKLAVRGIARSGKPQELLERCGISANHIVEAVKAAI
jgi:transketolase